MLKNTGILPERTPDDVQENVTNSNSPYRDRTYCMIKAFDPGSGHVTHVFDGFSNQNRHSPVKHGPHLCQSDFLSSVPSSPGSSKPTGLSKVIVNEMRWSGCGQGSKLLSNDSSINHTSTRKE